MDATMNKPRIAVAACVLILCPRVFADGIRIGHAEVMAVPAIPQATMERIAQFKWYFAHASVGDDMMNGITALHSSDADRYRIQRQSDDGYPPSSTTSGFIYDYQRGNPDWSEKVQWFEQYASNGWRNSKVNLCLNKFCWIDPYADTNVYLQSMMDLEGRYPDTLFVYMTIPLTGDSGDSENDLRNTFNRTVRDFCASRNRVLYDVADIEAHDTNGAPQVYSTTNQLMYLGFAVSFGDWHLNAVGRPWVARGFYALGAALFAADRDGDGQSDGDELIAGSCPTNPASSFRFGSPANNALGAPVVSWNSASNRVYTLQRGTNLSDGAAFTNLSAALTATPPANVYTDSPAGSGPWFYKVSARQ